MQQVDWLLAAKTFVGGAIIGALFTLVKWPIPAPQVFEGIVGIAGVWIGFALVEIARRYLSR